VVARTIASELDLSQEQAPERRDVISSDLEAPAKTVKHRLFRLAVCFVPRFDQTEPGKVFFVTFLDCGLV